MTDIRDPWRPRLHYTASRGWINDPNGLVHYGGKYHLFAQHNPVGPDNKSPMHWAHADSADLIRWSRLPIALFPDMPYDSLMGCWSGSAAEDGGRLHLVYSGVSGEKAVLQTVCLATSADGVRFAKHPANPVIPGPPEGFSNDFRDPRVFRHGDRWRVVIGSSRDGRGCALLYESPDLVAWKFLGPLATSDGTGGTMWECPDFFPLGDRWTLVVSPIGVPGIGSMALIGRMDDDATRLVVEETVVLDFGPDFYAPQTLAGPDGRRIMIGWMDHWGAPEPPTVAAGWRGALTIPRILCPGPGGRGLAIEPAAGLAAARGPLALDGPGSIEMETGDIEVEIEDSPGGTGQFDLVLRGSRDGCRGTLITFDAGDDALVLDRTGSGRMPGGMTRIPVAGMASFAGPAVRPPASLAAAARSGKRMKFRIVLDACSVEVFAGDPPTVPCSALIFPEPGDKILAARVTGTGVGLAKFHAWPFNPSC
jgi:beta-fructofuranosidase